MDILIYFDSHLFLWRTFWSWNIFRPESLFRFDLWNLSLLRIKKNFFGDSSTIFVILHFAFLWTDQKLEIKIKDENKKVRDVILNLTQPAITCSKLTIEALEQGVKYVQS